MDFEMEATSPQFTAPICFESNFSLPFFFLFLFCFVVVFFFNFCHIDRIAYFKYLFYLRDLLS